MSSFTYPVNRVGDRLIFYFVSLNDQGTNPVFKIVTYEPVNRYGARYYNLGFGDYSKDTGLPDDKAITNNGDMRMVLETVVSTLKFFFQECPDETVHIDGSNQARKDYYHKLINDYWYRIQELYLVHGCNAGITEIFQKGMKYEFILISLKKA